MRTTARLAVVVALAALFGVSSVPASHATQADATAPAAQTAAKYVLHVDGMT